MSQRRRQREQTFVIQCSWCGSKIRDDRKEETTAVCLKCFYRILSNHLRAQKRTVYGEFVSDR